MVTEGRCEVVRDGADKRGKGAYGCEELVQSDGARLVLLDGLLEDPLIQYQHVLANGKENAVERATPNAPNTFAHQSRSL